MLVKFEQARGAKAVLERASNRGGLEVKEVHRANEMVGADGSGWYTPNTPSEGTNIWKIIRNSNSGGTSLRQCCAPAWLGIEGGLRLR